MASIPPSEDYLAWFLGPKAEHAHLLEENILLILRDYIHWRRNYFPGDKILITQNAKKDLAAQYDTLVQNVISMTAELRRNFPFYSPRYIAHQLSDTTLPGVIGYFAGMLFNANNVTTEAAPVTVEWEIQACCRVMAMLGYQPPPAPPRSRTEYASYLRDIQAEFGWAHITHGGTTANIEALWFARTVRYAPLAVREVAVKYNLPVLVPRRLGESQRRGVAASATETTDIRTLAKSELFLLTPNESISLLLTYLKAAAAQLGKSSKDAIKDLDDASFSAANGIGPAIWQFNPVIFVSGAKHYSITKAAQILGLGRKSICIVGMDSSFRMDIADLERKIRLAVSHGKVPLAVVAIAGTTEEGAVDPIDKILDLRARLEVEQIASFWLHIDAAWGGYMRSLFRWSDTVIDSLTRAFDIDPMVDLPSFHSNLMSRVQSRLQERHTELELLRSKLSKHADTLLRAAQEGDAVSYVDGLTFLRSAPWSELLPIRVLDRKAWEKFVRRHHEFDASWVAEHELLQRLSDILKVDPKLAPIEWHSRMITRLDILLQKQRGVSHLGAALKREDKLLRQYVTDHDQDAYASHLETVFRIADWTRALQLRSDQFKVSARNRLETVQAYVRGPVDVGFGDFMVEWPHEQDVCNAFVAFPEADSITVDPHKMGYVPYPCGIVAFRNDRVRHFALEDAPYITSARRQMDAHLPPRHVTRDYILEHSDGSRGGIFDPPPVEVEAFAPFILEGSRPGAAAAALWLSTQTIPLTMRGHGAIVRASLLAARSLYEWIWRWKQVLDAVGEEAHYELVTLTPHPPDTNIVAFVVPPRGARTLTEMNLLTTAVYESFSIQAELGEREYSYSQPYFLSHTPLRAPDYAFGTMKSLLDRCKVDVDDARATYPDQGIVILRAAVMNPYIHPMQSLGVGDVIKDFMRELHKAAELAVRGPLKSPPKSRP